MTLCLSPCGCSFAEKLHESALDVEPPHAGEVEQEGHEDQVEGHPLVVRVVHDGVAPLTLLYS